MKKELIIFGTAELAEVAHFYFKNDSDYDIVAFTATSDRIKEEKLLDLPIVPFENIESEFPPDRYSMFIAIGPSGVNKVREKFYNKAKQKGYTLPSYICSKSAHWDNPNIGDNCFILENQTIQPYVTIGNNVTIWSGNHVGHHSRIGDHCFVTSHVVISGGVVVEPYCFLGVNATLRDHIIIRESCIIGAGATILKSTEPNSVYIGTAAKVYSNDSSKVKL